MVIYLNNSINKILQLAKLYGIFIAVLVTLALCFQVALIKLNVLPSYFDEIITFVILLMSIIWSKKDLVVRRLLQIYCILFLFYLMISISALSHRGLVNVVFQIFIHLKYILFFIFLWKVWSPQYCQRIILYLMVGTIAFLILNLVTGDLFNQIFQNVVQQRGGLIRPIGIQADTGSLGTTLALLAVFYITTLEPVYQKYRYYLLIFFTALILLSTVRAALLIIPILLIWWFKDSFKSFFTVIIFLFIGMIFINSNRYVDELIDITVQNIEWTIENPVESSYIRGIMLYFSVELANENFPIGTGAATYGTVTSTDSYVYADIGLRNSRYFIDKVGIYDSNLASLLGEFGYLGVLVYFIGFYFVLLTPAKVLDLGTNKQFSFVLFLLVIGYSIVTPIFMNTYPAFILALVIVGAYSGQNHQVKLG
jgi:hypothetical protein